MYTRIRHIRTFQATALALVFAAWLPLANAQYQQTDLVSNGIVANTTNDQNLKNAWGISLGPSTPIWISDNGSGLATVYTGAGQPAPVGNPLVVTIPGAGGGAGAPTGQLFNSTASDFLLAPNDATSKAVFIFAGEDGTVAAWNPQVGATNAAIVADNSASSAVYKGIALGSSNGANRLYLADFHNNAVSVLDAAFAPTSVSGGFTDPNLPAGFAPFNVANIGGNLFVSYAMQDAAKHDDVKAPGNGVVNEFDANGNLITRVATGGVLDSPWAMVLAPSDFGQFSNDLLVGNFGDGTINVFDPTTFALLGKLTDAKNQPIVIDGLWGLAFGNDKNGAAHNALFFTAGPNDEADGLFGKITVATVPVPVSVPVPAAAMTFPLGALASFYAARRMRISALRH